MLLGHIEFPHSLIHTTQAIPAIVVSNIGTYRSPECYHGLVEFFIRDMLVTLESKGVCKLWIELRSATETLYRIVMLSIK